MNDIISRQAAIDVADAVWSVTGDTNVAKVWDQIKDLPSAQPEKRTEERAETHACDLIDREAAVDAIYHHLPSVSRMEARLMLHEVPSAQAEQRWIPCSERLPKSNGVYIVTRTIEDGFTSADIVDACYFDGSNTWHDDTRVNHGRKYLNCIIAWMPLPEPYREGEQDEKKDI